MIIPKKFSGLIKVDQLDNRTYRVRVDVLFPNERKAFETALLKFARSFDNTTKAIRNHQKLSRKGK